MLVSKLHTNDLTDEIIDKILYEGLCYNGEVAECALVLGSNKAPLYRVPLAAELYKASKINKALMSGGKAIKTEQGILTEAQLMKNKAVELGIPEQDILIEEQSMTTKENIICSLLPLEREYTLSKLKNIILITTNYHMRRSMFMAQTYLPRWVYVIPCPADDINTRRNNWWLTEAGQQRATDEVLKIISYIKEGSIPDFDI